MTKAFLETMILQPKNEKLVVSAFSKENLRKIKAFDEKRKVKLSKKAERRLSVQDLF